MTIKELAKELTDLSKEQVIELITELKDTYGLTAPEPEIIEKESNSSIIEEKTTVDITLQTIGPNKLGLIKVWKQLTGTSLIESKTLIESAPIKLKEGISKEEANQIKTEFENLGAEIIIS